METITKRKSLLLFSVGSLALSLFFGPLPLPKQRRLRLGRSILFQETSPPQDWTANGALRWLWRSSMASMT